jgi:small subunit ribosomal protein S3Ae
MAIGKNKRVSKGGKRGNKKKVIEPMSKKEWFDVVAPRNFKVRQFAKTVCNKTIGIRTVADNMRGRVYETNLADLDNASTKDQPFKKMKLQVQEVQGRNLLTTFHSMSITTDKMRSLFRKWCTMIESVVDAQTKDGYTLRFFVTAFTARQKGQLSKNCYAPGKLEKWVRSRITKMIKKRISSVSMNRAVSLLSHDILSDALQERCNPILPLRDLKIVKAKVIRSPKLDTQKLFDLHGKVPESMEDKPRVVEVAPVVAAAAATAAPAAAAAASE